MAPYADDIQSPDWIRSYPGGNAGDALAYRKPGFLWSEASAKGLPVKIYGEYVENESFLQPNGSTDEPSWSDLYTDSQNFESGAEPALYYQNTITSEASVPAVSNYLIKNFPPFDLNIPDQFRVDLWLQDFNKDVAAGTVPTLSVCGSWTTTRAGHRVRTPSRPTTTWLLGALSTTSATATCGHRRQFSSRRMTRRTASTTSTVIAALAISLARTRCRLEGNRPHLLHAGQHGADDRANPRPAAHEPVRPGGITDADGFREGRCSPRTISNRGPTFRTRSHWTKALQQALHPTQR